MGLDRVETAAGVVDGGRRPPDPQRDPGDQVLGPGLVHRRADLEPVVGGGVGSVEQPLALDRRRVGRDLARVQRRPGPVVEVDPEPAVELALVDHPFANLLEQGVPAVEPMLPGDDELGLAQGEALGVVGTRPADGAGVARPDLLLQLLGLPLELFLAVDAVSAAARTQLATVALTAATMSSTLRKVSPTADRWA